MSPNRSVNRLLQYRTCLLKFQDLGFEKVFSYNLGEEAGVTPEQVRKDFSNFNIKGHKKGGYNINELLFTINNIFKSYKVQKIIVVGMGNIGTALTQFINFKNNNLTIVAGFDINPTALKKKFDIPVYPVNEMGNFIKANRIKIAVLAVPGPAAQEICNTLVTAGIKGILNFSPVILKTPNNVSVKNVNLIDELEGLIYSSVLS